jgi:hypothetical protein
MAKVRGWPAETAGKEMPRSTSYITDDEQGASGKCGVGGISPYIRDGRPS